MADGPLEPPMTEQEIEWACEQKWMSIELQAEEELEHELKQEQEWELALVTVAKPA